MNYIPWSKIGPKGVTITASTSGRVKLEPYLVRAVLCDPHAPVLTGAGFARQPYFVFEWCTRCHMVLGPARFAQ